MSFRSPWPGRVRGLFEYKGDPVVFLDMDSRSPQMTSRGLNELEIRVGRFVQPHRMFQARDSGQSSQSSPRSNRVVGLSEVPSAGNTSFSQRVSSIPSTALVPGL